MRILIVSQALLVLIGMGLLHNFNTTHNALSYGAGSGLVFVNFLLLSVAWTLIFRKKLIALAVSIIVIKYAILGVLLYVLVHEPWLDFIWFTAGVASFTISALVYAFQTKRQ